MTPKKTYKDKAGKYCREYVTKATIAGKEEQAYGKACRQPDGSWKIVS
jgi:surface antigen